MIARDRFMLFITSPWVIISYWILTWATVMSSIFKEWGPVYLSIMTVLLIGMWISWLTSNRIMRVNRRYYDRMKLRAELWFRCKELQND